MKVKELAAPTQRPLADQLVLASVRLTRTLRALNRNSGLSGPHISLLAVVVHAGRITARDLVRLEEVTPATISRLVAELEGDGLLKRRRDLVDTRLLWIETTARGRRLVNEGHQRRLRPLVQAMESLSPVQRATLAEVVPLMQQLVELITSQQAETAPGRPKRR